MENVGAVREAVMTGQLPTVVVIKAGLYILMYCLCRNQLYFLFYIGQAEQTHYHTSMDHQKLTGIIFVYYIARL